MKLLAITLLATSLAVFAQDSEQYRTCIGKAKTQADMSVCASKEAARADSKLNEIYQKVLSRAADQTDAVPKIKASERAWIAYRDAYLEAMYPAKDKQAEYGSVYPMKADLLRAELTERQVSALNQLLKQYSGPEQ